MDNIVDHGQINNNNEVDVIEYIKKMAVWSFHVIRNYDHRHRRVVYGYRLHFIFLLSVMITVCFLPMWLYEVVYIISLYEHLVNMTACWDAMDYNFTPMSYQLHSDHLMLRTNLNWHFLCFAESKLLESSEYKMFLLLLCCCTLQSSTREALWKYVIVITLNFKKFNKKEFYGVLWEYIVSFFWEDELYRNVQAASSTVVDKFNPLCICTSYCDLNCCLSSPARSSTLSVIDLRNLDVTEGAAVPVRRHFHSNIGRTGYIAFSSDLARFSGSFQYPLPKKKAEADRIGHCRNGFVFTVYHGNKEFAVKKVMYRPEEIEVYSQLCHPNITDLVAVLIGKEHKRHKDKYHAYYFMPKVGVNFKNVLSANQHGCLKYLKASLVDRDWALVLLNVKHILKSVLNASHYMNSQGVAHNNIKASNVAIKMVCRCGDINVLLCTCCQQAFAVKLTGFSSSKTMYNCHYASEVDLQSFGHFVLDVFVGKCRQLEDTQDIYKSKFGELEKCFSDTPGLCDVIQKCFQVIPDCPTTAEDLLQSNFFD